jgi:hypothetical protein
MRRLSHSLITWVLLAQSVALVVDKKHNTGDVFLPWVAVATFVSKEHCLDDAARRTAETMQRAVLSQDAGMGTIVTYRYRCVGDER